MCGFSMVLGCRAEAGGWGTGGKVGAREACMIQVAHDLYFHLCFYLKYSLLLVGNRFPV